VSWPASLTLALALAALSLATGCATFRADSTVCPEYRDLRCATAPECSMDARRGCRVCACSPALGADRDGKFPSGVAPDRRVP
jgi:hypothetical protein